MQEHYPVKVTGYFSADNIWNDKFDYSANRSPPGHSTLALTQQFLLEAHSYAVSCHACTRLLNNKKNHMEEAKKGLNKVFA